MGAPSLCLAQSEDPNTMSDAITLKKVSLHMQEGASDKVYEVALVQSDGGHRVFAWNGRRGSTLTQHDKTGAAPVSLEAAEKVFAKLVNEKSRKGYQLVGEGADRVEIVGERVDTGMRAQLLEPIEPDDIESKLRDPNWIAQIKHDGVRMQLRVDGDSAVSANRRGQVSGMPVAVADGVRALGDCEIDGECVGEVLHVFDVTARNGLTLKHLSVAEREAILVALIPNTDSGAVRRVASAYTEAEKRSMLEHAVTSGAEGIVFKRADAPYAAGLAASGNSWMKLKFVQTLSAVVDGANTKRSVRISLRDADGAPLPVGSVTVPANQEIPPVGAVVEVRYKAAFPDGSLEQPALIGLRTDILPEECLATQRRFRGEAAKDEAALRAVASHAMNRVEAPTM